MVHDTQQTHARYARDASDRTYQLVDVESVDYTFELAERLFITTKGLEVGTCIMPVAGTICPGLCRVEAQPVLVVVLS